MIRRYVVVLDLDLTRFSPREQDAINILTKEQREDAMGTAIATMPTVAVQSVEEIETIKVKL